ncbi:MAG: shikimate dehydrogenase [Thaumarchaeota archaeon]|nr:shikimate dehydrogenase [Nitrososphaerota archaeon]MDE1867377.1 shikimate dehydrogenase [Nitrososphaerota archaeon]
MTKTYAVIGDPIDHSLSPALHNPAFAFLRLDCTYIAYRIPKGELDDGVKDLKKIGIAGFNVTIPHKIDMMRLLDEADEECKTVGATNTVVNTDGHLKGYNTDVDGFLDPIRKRKIDCKGSDVLLIGAGGAARAIVAGFAKEKVRKITVTNRTQERAEEIVRFARRLGLESEYLDLVKAGDTAANFRFIVNATSVGLKGMGCPISTKNITKDSIVYDIVYMPVETPLIQQSKEKRAVIIYGWEMLLAQAMKSFEIWTGVPAPYEAMKLTLLGRF